MTRASVGEGRLRPIRGMCGYCGTVPCGRCSRHCPVRGVGVSPCGRLGRHWLQWLVLFDGLKSKSGSAILKGEQLKVVNLNSLCNVTVICEEDTLTGIVILMKDDAEYTR